MFDTLKEVQQCTKQLVNTNTVMLAYKQELSTYDASKYLEDRHFPVERLYIKHVVMPEFQWWW